jgi:hypothetical protein
MLDRSLAKQKHSLIRSPFHFISIILNTPSDETDWEEMQPEHIELLDLVANAFPMVYSLMAENLIPIDLSVISLLSYLFPFVRKLTLRMNALDIWLLSDSGDWSWISLLSDSGDWSWISELCTALQPGDGRVPFCQVNDLHVSLDVAEEFTNTNGARELVLRL